MHTGVAFCCLSLYHLLVNSSAFHAASCWSAWSRTLVRIFLQLTLTVQFYLCACRGVHIRWNIPKSVGLLTRLGGSAYRCRAGLIQVLGRFASLRYRLRRTGVISRVGFRSLAAAYCYGCHKGCSKSGSKYIFQVFHGRYSMLSQSLFSNVHPSC